MFTFGVLLCVLSQMLMAQDIPDFRIPQAAVNQWATRNMRNFHFVWHNVRDSWSLLTDDEREQIRQLGWAPPRPSQIYVDGQPVPITDNGSGEDFLYFHRGMIRRTNEWSQAVCRYARVVGWNPVPPPGDARYPVPPIYTVPATFEGTDALVREWKTDEFYNNVMKPEEDALNDPEVLRNLTLGQLGSRLEYGIHVYLHVRMSSNPSIGFRPQPGDVPVPNVEERFDNPAYNWLGDFYSAHVNRMFWKIHGWVDDKIEQWREANGLEEINWQYTWEGGDLTIVPQLEGIGEDEAPGPNPETPAASETPAESETPAASEEGAGRLLSGAHDHHSANVLEVARILIQSGKCKSFYQVPAGVGRRR